ncbi:MAG: hypothetical protein JO023_25580 [Chloroflexi bacterium]|nr:hypothetical protein [Chloroflexota bacterium]
MLARLPLERDVVDRDAVEREPVEREPVERADAEPVEREPVEREPVERADAEPVEREDAEREPLDFEPVERAVVLAVVPREALDRDERAERADELPDCVSAARSWSKSLSACLLVFAALRRSATRAEVTSL